VAETSAGGQLLIVGCGNPLRGDDGVGLVIARALLRRLRFAATVREHRGDGMALLDLWQGARAVILVDAAEGGVLPGDFARFDAVAAPLPANLRSCSTHAFGIAEAVELGRTLNTLPATLIVYAVYGEEFAYGVGLSRNAKVAARHAVAAMMRESKRILSSRSLVEAAQPAVSGCSAAQSTTCQPS
jgi:hydrogenase maturation protease